VRPATAGVALVVADDGPGIPTEERGRVLRRFHLLERIRTIQGSGLGLALVRAVAELHGARLQLEDNHPGLRITVEFGHHGTVLESSGARVVQ